ncbi:MAG: hypothetical protein JKY10_03805 [Cohaesibacteraceae bacterium]|nr:hypothetical protein [Cohaesibacteraceae bacterium]
MVDRGPNVSMPIRHPVNISKPAFAALGDDFIGDPEVMNYWRFVNELILNLNNSSNVLMSKSIHLISDIRVCDGFGAVKTSCISARRLRAKFLRDE